MESQEYPLLILLVGANPLPNYLAACTLRPRRLALVYTSETKDAKDRLKAVLESSLDGTSFVENPDPCISDATSATEVTRVIDRLMPADRATRGEVWLNYTGGTKVMAVHARMAFQKAVGEENARRYASYLDEGGGTHQPRLRFDDGNSTALNSAPLRLRTILELHGITGEPRMPKNPTPTSADAREILRKVLEDPGVATLLYDERQRLLGKMPKEIHCEGLNCWKKQQLAEMAQRPFVASTYGLSLSLSRMPTAEIPKKTAEQWYKFIGGEWLEEWVGEQIRGLNLNPESDIMIGLNAFRGTKKAQLEVDIGVIRGHRSYFISCTTDRTKELCKSKLFEVAVRSRQLGGDLARAALVCLANDSTVGKLQADIDELWGASNTTRVFGLSDLQSWFDSSGKEPNLSLLKQWLES